MLLNACAPLKSSKKAADKITFFEPANSIVGMREFLLSITNNSLDSSTPVDFIASESPTPPSWDSVENNPAKIRRTFNATDKKTRKLYFSVTDEYMAESGAIKLDLAGASKDEEKAKSKEKAPGLMLPGTDYYVHAYSKGSHLKTSPAITTVDYPPASFAFPVQYDDDPNHKPFKDQPKYSDYAWNMTMWAETISEWYKYIEVGTEVAYLPFRYLALVDQTRGPTGQVLVSTICPRSNSLDLKIQRVARDPEGGGFETKASYRQGDVLDASGRVSATQYDGADIVVFVSSPQLPKTNPPGKEKQILDAMIKVRRTEATATSAPLAVYYSMAISCFDSTQGGGPVALGGAPGYSIKYVDN